MYTFTKHRSSVIVPFTEKVEVFGQVLTVIGKATIEHGEDGRKVGLVEFTTIGVTGYSEGLKEVVFTFPIRVRDLSYKQLLELEYALADQCSESLFETVANRD